MTIVWSWDGHIENGVLRGQVRVDLALGHGFAHAHVTDIRCGLRAEDTICGFRRWRGAG